MKLDPNRDSDMSTSVDKAEWLAIIESRGRSFKRPVWAPRHGYRVMLTCQMVAGDETSFETMYLDWDERVPQYVMTLYGDQAMFSAYLDAKYIARQAVAAHKATSLLKRVIKKATK